MLPIALSAMLGAGNSYEQDTGPVLKGLTAHLRRWTSKQGSSKQSWRWPNVPAQDRGINGYTRNAEELNFHPGHPEHAASLMFSLKRHEDYQPFFFYNMRRKGRTVPSRWHAVLGSSEVWLFFRKSNLPASYPLPPSHQQERQWMSKHEAHRTCGNLNLACR